MMALRFALFGCLLLTSAWAAPTSTAEEKIQEFKNLLKNGNGDDLPSLDPFVETHTLKDVGQELKIRITVKGLSDFEITELNREEKKLSGIYPAISLLYEALDFKKGEGEVSIVTNNGLEKFKTLPKDSDEDIDEIDLEDLYKLGNINFTLYNLTFTDRWELADDGKTIEKFEVEVTGGKPRLTLDGISRTKGAGSIIYRFVDQAFDMLFDAVKDDLKYEFDDEDKEILNKLVSGDKDALSKYYKQQIKQLKAAFEDSSEEIDNNIDSNRT